jgi:hypothetical protein
MRAGGPETDRPPQPHRDTLGPGRVGTSSRPRVRGEAPYPTRAPGWLGECSGGGNLRKASTAGSLVDPATARTRHGSKALKTAVLRQTLPRERASGPGNARRAWTPRGAPIVREGNALKGETHGRSGVHNAGREGGASREGGIQTPDAARGCGGIRGRQHGSAPPRMCRRVAKAQESQHRSTCRETGGTVRGPGDEL